MFVACFHVIGTILYLAHFLPTCTSEDGGTAPRHESNEDKRPRVAIIGGGVAGAFAAKYLSDYDTQSPSKQCSLESIVVYDPSPVEETPPSSSGKIVPSSGEFEDGWQGGRVAAVTLSDGTLVEIGGSVVYDGNKLVVDLIRGDPNITRGKPFTPGKQKENEMKATGMPSGFGIYDGGGKWPLLTSNISPYLRKLKLFWRYNLDLIRMSRAASRALTSFDLIYDLLESEHPATFFSSPADLFASVGLLQPSRLSFDDFLDGLGLSREVEWWRRWLPDQGCLRSELLTAMTLNTNNQELSQMNGLAGMVSFIPSGGNLFSVEGGNHQLIQSAFKQAQKNYAQHCGGSGVSTVRHERKIVTTVVSDMEKMDLWSNQEELGQYDVVVLATPLQHSKISFLIKSHMDEAVLHSMPLGGLVDGNLLDGDELRRMPAPLPSSATRRYTSVVTTVVSNATLQASHFHLSEENVPRSIFVTVNGRDEERITTITRMTADGVYKVFSPERLPAAVLENIFGPCFILEYEKLWGGEHGGATPNYNGGGEVPTPYLLYDAGLGTKGRAEGPALYYVNSIEALVAVIEMSAIGAKNVAKNVALRLGLLAASSRSMGEEL